MQATAWMLAIPRSGREVGAYKGNSGDVATISLGASKPLVGHAPETIPPKPRAYHSAAADRNGSRVSDRHTAMPAKKNGIAITIEGAGSEKGLYGVFKVKWQTDSTSSQRNGIGNRECKPAWAMRRGVRGDCFENPCRT